MTRRPGESRNHEKGNSAVPASPSWQSLLLICKDCRRRKDGPTPLKAKKLASNIKSSLKVMAPRGRIVLTTCLKLCPNNATAVAFVAGAAAPQIVAIESSDHLQEMLPRLIESE